MKFPVCKHSPLVEEIYTLINLIHLLPTASDLMHPLSL